MPPQSIPQRRLPPEPSLEQLKKQAKELLERYRSGDADARAEVRQFEREPDAAEFRLNDAQRVLARAYGFQSWTKLKAFVDGVTVRRLAEAVKSGELDAVRGLIHARPELVNTDMAENDEHRAVHFAVLQRDAAMTRLLMEAGADARKGIYPHREATTALAIARDRGYSDVLAAIEEVEQQRREALSCPNVLVTPVQEQINAAIRAGDNGLAIRLLEADESLIRACDRRGGSPLHVAAQFGNAAMVDWLLERGANPRKEDADGYTPLDRAALATSPRNDGAEQFPAIAQRLLMQGGILTMRGAVALGDVDRVRELAAANPALLRENNSRTGGLLTLATNHGRLEVVNLLLDLGCDPDERLIIEAVEEPTYSWGSPLWYAAFGGRLEIARLLLDRGADPNANVYASGWPLRNAYQQKDEAMKRLLVERGAKMQPYMVAEAGDVQAARRLLEQDPGEEMAQELTWSAACHGQPGVIEIALPHLPWKPDDSRWNWILIQPVRGVDPDGEDHEGFFTAMALLLDRPVDPNVPNGLGQTVLHFAAAREVPTEEERTRFTAMLLDHGARIDVRDELLRSTPLGWACRWGRKPMADLLVANGSPVNEPDAPEWATPLAWAVKMGHDEIAAMLRERGATK